MKIYFAILCLTLCFIKQGLAQNKALRTTVDISISNLVDTILPMEVSIQRPFDLEDPMESHKLECTDGHCSYTFVIEKPTNVSVILGDKVLGKFPLSEMLFEPGDNIHITIPNINKTELSDLIFSGKGSEKLRFLQNTFSAYLIFARKQKWLLQTTLEDFIRTQDAAYTILDSASLANRRLVKENVYDILRAQAISLHFISLMSIMAERINEDTIRSLYQDYIVNRNILSNFTKPGMYLHLSYLQKELMYLALLDYGQQRKIPVGNFPGGDISLYYSIISNFYRKMPEIKYHLLAQSLVTYMQAKGIDTLMDQTVKRFLTEVPKGTLRDQVMNRYQLVKKNNSRGVPFFNFSLKDDNGKFVKLSDFRGKVVFIDFYFTGCGPCRLLVPTIRKMEEKYKDKNIVFVSISIDATKKIWDTGRGIFSSPTAVQLYTNGEGGDHPLIKHAGVVSYPTMFLIDENGNILDGNFSYKPEAIASRIEKALKQ